MICAHEPLEHVVCTKTPINGDMVLVAPIPDVLVCKFCRCVYIPVKTAAEEGWTRPKHKGVDENMYPVRVPGDDLPLPRCKGCGVPLRAENSWMTDGCPCNSPRGCNDAPVDAGEAMYGIVDFGPMPSTTNATWRDSHATLVAAGMRLADAEAVLHRDRLWPALHAQATRLKAENATMQKDLELINVAIDRAAKAEADNAERGRRIAELEATICGYRDQAEAKLGALTRAVVEAGCAVMPDGTVANRRAEELRIERDFQDGFRRRIATEFGLDSWNAIESELRRYRVVASLEERLRKTIAQRDEELRQAREAQGPSDTHSLPCGCEYGWKFNGGNPAWFAIETCERHKSSPCGVCGGNGSASWVCHDCSQKYHAAEREAQGDAAIIDPKVLRTLVAKWRAEVERWKSISNDYRATDIRDCADELEALLPRQL